MFDKSLGLLFSFTKIFELLAKQPDWLIYFYIALLMFTNSLVMVPPSEYICLAAGILVGLKKINLTAAIIACVIANYGGTLLWYRLGKSHRLLGKNIANATLEKPKTLWTKIKVLYISKLKAIERLYPTRGIALAIILRNIPFVRSISSYPLGQVQMPFLKFTAATLVGILIWVSLWTSLGLLLGKIVLLYKWPLALGIGLLSLGLLKLLFRNLGNKVLE